MTFPSVRSMLRLRMERDNFLGVKMAGFAIIPTQVGIPVFLLSPHSWSRTPIY